MGPNDSQLGFNQQSSVIPNPGFQPTAMNQRGMYGPTSNYQTYNMQEPQNITYAYQSPRMMGNQNIQNGSQFVGKFIGNLNEITPSDIPMDGRPAIFPANDWSGIIVKCWRSNGQIATVRFIPDPTQYQQEAQQAQDLDSIRNRLDHLEQMLKTTNSNTNKEG